MFLDDIRVEAVTAGEAEELVENAKRTRELKTDLTTIESTGWDKLKDEYYVALHECNMPVAEFVKKKSANSLTTGRVLLEGDRTLQKMFDNY